MQWIRDPINMWLDTQLEPRIPGWVTPNGLTVSRLVGVLVVGFLYLMGFWLVAFLVYIVAAVTDYLDGWLARRRNKSSAWGARLDELTDKIIVMALLALFFLDGKIDIKPSDWLLWAAVLIVLRELVITVLRQFKESGVSLLSAKLKTTVQLVGVGVLLVGSYHSGCLGYILYLLGGLTLWCSIVLGYYSGYYYLRRALI